MSYSISVAPPSDSVLPADGKTAPPIPSAKLDATDEWRDIVSDTKRILVAATGSKETVNCPPAGVAVARALASTDARVITIDTRGIAALTAATEDPIEPSGFQELLAGKASYADVIFRDQLSPVHFIQHGQSASPTDLRADGRLATILEALSMTYDYVVVEAEGDALSKLTPLFPVAMVTTAGAALDPSAAAAIVRISSAGDASIHLLMPDSIPADGDKPENAAAA